MSLQRTDNIQYFRRISQYEQISSARHRIDMISMKTEHLFERHTNGATDGFMGSGSNHSYTVLSIEKCIGQGGIGTLLPINACALAG
jgi:hypothetical protein